MLFRSCNIRARKLDNDTLALARVNGAIVFLALENQAEHKIVEDAVPEVEAQVITVGAGTLDVGIFGELVFFSFRPQR